MRQNPYFINPDIDALPSASPEERARLVRHIAACVGDEVALRAIIGIDPAEFASFYPDMQPPELSTEATIDSFINRFSSEQAAEAPEIEELVVAPAIDYASMLESESDAPDDLDADDLDAADLDAADPGAADPGAAPTSGSASDPTADLISSFLKAVPPKTPTRHSKPAPQSAPELAPAVEPEPAPQSAPELAPAVEPEPAPERNSTPESKPAHAPESESTLGGSGLLSAGGHRPAESRPSQPADSSLSEALFKLMVKNGNYTKALEIINELSLNNPKKSIYFAYQMRFLKKLIKNQENAKP